MAMTQAEIEQLSVKERIELIGKIWDSIEASHEKIELIQAQKEELDRRLEAYRTDKDRGATWEEVEDDIKRSLHG